MTKYSAETKIMPSNGIATLKNYLIFGISYEWKLALPAAEATENVVVSGDGFVVAGYCTG